LAILFGIALINENISVPRLLGIMGIRTQQS
jgi:hypothetical protein